MIKEFWLFLSVFFLYFLAYSTFRMPFLFATIQAAMTIPGFVLLILLKRFIPWVTAQELLAAIVRTLFYAPSILLVSHIPFVVFPVIFIPFARIRISKLPDVSLYYLFIPPIVVLLISLVYSTFVILEKNRERKLKEFYDSMG
ncbi:MAG: hypothetical protein IPN19_00215 [Elusimicrobia bacterium]|nr:hypothetical protein [Elusimicrobiota bacterium]